MRLIDADVLIQALGELKTIITGVMYSEDVVNTINSAPTIDAQPVVHGRWKSVDYDIAYECSVCNHPTEYNLSNYCPNCGAKMDGGTDHD